jgi:hypothetical protein
MSYIESILRSFKSNGVKTRAKAEDLKKQWKEKKQQRDKSKTGDKGNKNSAAGKGKTNGFNNFTPREYDRVELENQLLKIGMNETSMSDEEFEKFMAERRVKLEPNDNQQKGVNNEIN